MEKNQNHPTARAFTLVELLALIAIVALLGCLILPILARAKQSPQAAVCLSNQRQLMQAALMYADDNGGLWFPNQPGQVGWVTDNLSWNAGDANDYDIGTFTNPATDLFIKYIRSPRIFRCPGDLSRTPDGRPRIRSVSANSAVGSLWQAAGCYGAGSPVTGYFLTGSVNNCDNTWRRYGKASDIISPKPALLSVFLDEHANSINDEVFAMQVANTNIGSQWVDVPATYHNGASGISFADGHVEMHKWVGTGIPNWAISWTGPNDFGGATPVAVNLADVLDIRWMQQRTSAFANH